MPYYIFSHALSCAGTVTALVQVYFRHFEDQLIRLAMGKPPNGHFIPGVDTGKLDADTIDDIMDKWILSVCRALSGIDILGLSGYVPKGSCGAATSDEVDVPWSLAQAA